MESSAGALRRIALFTPVPPARTGTADYAAALIPALSKYARVEVFAKPPRVFHPDHYDAVIYQIANNPWHADIYETALRHPGIVVLHEANLHDLIRGMTAHQPAAYLREIVYEMFGQEPESVQNTDLASSSRQPRTFSMLRRVLERSRACIVHSRYVAGEVRRKGFLGNVCTIAHGARTATYDAAALRAKLQVRADERLLGMFGYQRPDKQILECLDAFRQLLDSHPACRLVIGGTSHPEIPLASRISELGLEDRVSVIGFQALEDLDGYIAACDIVLNLRWPTFGETSGIAVRAFGLGKTVVVSDSGSDREWPDDICVRVPCDRFQPQVLPEVLEWLVSRPDVTQEIGSNARRWIAENATWDLVARRYAEFAASCYQPTAAKPFDAMDAVAVREYFTRWSPAGSDSEQYLKQHERRLIRTIQLTPAGEGRDRVLEMGCYLQIAPALRDISRYGEIRGCYLGKGGTDVRNVQSRDGDYFECVLDLFDCERHPFPYPDEHFATVLFCEILEHLRRDPMWTLSEIHRILKPEGILVLTTPNIVSLRAINAVLRGLHPAFYCRYPDPDGASAGDSKHEREYTPVEISKLLTAAGFLVNHIETGPYGNESSSEAAWVENALASLGQSADLRGDCIFAVGRKASIPRERRPEWLYDFPPISLENS